MTRKEMETVQLKLRFPEKLRLRIESAAAKNGRSMNAEIVHRLEQSFEKDDRSELVEETATAVVNHLLRIDRSNWLIEEPSGKKVLVKPSRNFLLPNRGRKP